MVAGGTPVGGRVLGVSTEDLQAAVLTDIVVVVSQRDGALILEPGDGGARVPLNTAGKDDAPSLHHREVCVTVLLSVKRVPRGNCQQIQHNDRDSMSANIKQCCNSMSAYGTQ